jgi:hypothetical protein
LKHPNTAGQWREENFSRARNDVSVNAYFAGIGRRQAGDKEQRRRFAAT